MVAGGCTAPEELGELPAPLEGLPAPFGGVPLPFAGVVWEIGEELEGVIVAPGEVAGLLSAGGKPPGEAVVPDKLASPAGEVPAPLGGVPLPFAGVVREIVEERGLDGEGV